MRPFIQKRNRPKDGFLKIRKSEIRTKESPRDTKRKVTMYIIIGKGKTPSPSNSEENVSQRLENSAKTVVEELDIDGCTTVDSDGQLEIKPAEVGFLAKLK